MPLKKDKSRQATKAPQLSQQPRPQSVSDREKTEMEDDKVYTITFGGNETQFQIKQSADD
jgi:hypothetical protein